MGAIRTVEGEVGSEVGVDACFVFAGELELANPDQAATRSSRLWFSADTSTQYPGKPECRFSRKAAGEVKLQMVHASRGRPSSSASFSLTERGLGFVDEIYDGARL